MSFGVFARSRLGTHEFSSAEVGSVAALGVEQRFKERVV
jgi:hypothetical protein